MTNLKNKTALITGSARGLGKAIAEQRGSKKAATYLVEVLAKEIGRGLAL